MIFLFYCLLQEVFKSDVHVAIPLDQVLGLCCVLSVKDYFRSKPDGFADKDVYVCESRYSTKARAFKKIKVLFLCSVVYWSVYISEFHGHY
jgi:protein polybromo-1